MSDDFAVIARDLKIPLEQVRQTIELLDAGNTIPFIARFRKDQTGGLDPEQVLAIKQRVSQVRALAERKSFVLKSIESQGHLTEALANDINAANNGRRVEDLYLPFKAKKQSLALTARQQGLEPLAEDIIAGAKTESELAAVALDYVRVDRGLSSVDEVMLGVGYLIAETFSERSDVRRELRRLIWTTGSLGCKSTKGLEPGESSKSTIEPALLDSTMTANDSKGSEPAEPLEPAAEIEHAGEDLTSDSNSMAIDAPGEAPEIGADLENGAIIAATIEQRLESDHSTPAADRDTSPDSEPSTAPSVETDSQVTTPLETPTGGIAGGISQPHSNPSPAGSAAKGARKGDKKKAAANPFADYEDFSESLKKIPHHRVLAINRGERAGLLKAKVRVDQAPLEAKVLELLAPESHNFRTFLAQCAQDALSRLIFPSLEREVRRELTEDAEQHALRVFSENLKALLLQPPLRGKRILAIDPGYKSGCAVAIVDEQGSVLHTDKLFVVGNQARREENRKKLAGWVSEQNVDLIAIGNGTACREAEQLVSDAIKLDLSSRQTRYVIVNEAGTSTYSTSDFGKEELPQLSVGARCAVSIARRLLDPLSELVKIPPANLGVGLYQHDIKAKHLTESLDEVVEACVNHVGVSINTASAPLLQYVAGLNQLTARRLMEFRQEKPFTNRQQLREVSGIGDATFIQAAGFLRIFQGDQPLDETAIHPESYPLVEKLLAKVGWSVNDWSEQRKQAASVSDGANTSQNIEGSRTQNPLSKLDPRQLASEFGTGELLMKDLLDSLQRPTHDPRTKNLGPVFRSGIIKLEDLQPEMQLESQIVNVVDFGVFVDVGLGYSCLVHVSELSRGFVRDLYQQYAVGDVLTTWVKEVDVARRRVKLTAIPPGSKKFERGPRPDRARNEDRRPPFQREQPAAQSGGGSGTASPPTTFDKSKTFSGQRGQRGQQRPPQDRQPFRGKKRAPGKFEQRPRIDRPSKPKPVKPITDEMLSGKKAMRSFSDLAQFFQKKTKPDEAEPGS